MGEPILRPEELDHYVRVFERTGFDGGIHWYRNMDRNWETTAPLTGAKVAVPALMVTAEWDPVLRPQLAAGMQAFVPDLETVMIEKCGHWTQQEKPRELNLLLTRWLCKRFL
jgi:pimeloyl-ACP methyl ester carboxylesterase